MMISCNSLVPTETILRDRRQIDGFGQSETCCADGTAVRRLHTGNINTCLTVQWLYQWTEVPCRIAEMALTNLLRAAVHAVLAHE
jgi:hypothetical protein